MLKQNGKRIENEDGELVAVVTNTERKAQRIRDRHGIPAFVGPIGLEAIDRLLADEIRGEVKAMGDEDDLKGKSRAELDEIAQGLGINLDRIDGTGKNGNVVAGDVKAAIEAARNREENPDVDPSDEPAVPDPQENPGHDD